MNWPEAFMKIGIFWADVLGVIAIIWIICWGLIHWAKISLQEELANIESKRKERLSARKTIKEDRKRSGNKSRI